MYAGTSPEREGVGVAALAARWRMLLP